MAKEEIINLIYDLKMSYGVTERDITLKLRAQMEFCKELRKKLSNFSLDAISQKSDVSQGLIDNIVLVDTIR